MKMWLKQNTIKIDLKQVKFEIKATWRVFSMDIADTNCQGIYTSLINELLSLKFI